MKSLRELAREIQREAQEDDKYLDRLETLRQIRRMIAFWEGPLSRAQVLIALNQMIEDEKEKSAR